MDHRLHRFVRQCQASPTLPPGTVQTVGDLKIRVVGNVATVSGMSHYTPAFGINATSYAFTDLYVRRGNTWRVASSRTVREATT
ncbi:nuclear transport factor 2 family protein [Paraburkholderia sp. PREW-6R]|uniref:nuclear transport factor 2 family protein n=1 Tax=Paraburkholderia sp. PREW-6R TaxID=3141544 RepID=UPI0031F4E81D